MQCGLPGPGRMRDLMLDLPTTSLVSPAGGLPSSPSDPLLGRRSSIVRQANVRSMDSPPPPPVVEIAPTPSTPRESHSDQSLNLLSHHTSLQSSSPIGDIIIKVEKNRPSVLRHAVRLMSTRRKHSCSSVHSERRHVLQNVGRTLQRTSSQLRRTRLFHVFYLFALPIYTVIGALIFQALDGEHDERLLREYNMRCREDREMKLAEIRQLCEHAGSDCFNAMNVYLGQVDECYRRWHAANRTITHSMSDFTNSLVYAFSVYTTIGYGNMAADTNQCRVATIIYGVLGIPLFFAFIKEEGNLFRHLFITAYNRIRKTKKQGCNCGPKRDIESAEPHRPPANISLSIPVQNGNGNGNCLGVPYMDDDGGGSPMQAITTHHMSLPKRKPFARNYSSSSMLDALANGNHSKKLMFDEQRKVFLAGVIILILYLLSASALFAVMTEFDYFTAVYFLFNSVALIGFGDVFPAKPEAILLNAVFIVFGVVLFSMCYFILQEEIREKAVEASRKARISISKYSQSLIQHTRSPWSRRNSPLFDANSQSPADPAASPSSAFERLRKRRQSAPAVSLAVPGRVLPKFRDV